ncbi:MAG TPA: GNAT family N-acetyltransferase [Methylibium sp.]|uniref:GNAT family N-acetyltransferase n=1 Tax=Methylibium sp. TaxID=2067992 RepID=UPI002DBB0A36|nr:GNAT family N-acetyltransferase [Methylibium sp.]HEU4459589.1 GNAT family N-acetyltransferase [Methylibium sp.]
MNAFQPSIDFASAPQEVRAAVLADAPPMARIYNEWIDDQRALPVPPRRAEDARRPMASSHVPYLSDAQARAWLDSHRSTRCPAWVMERHGGVVGWLSFYGQWGRTGFTHCAEIGLFVSAQARRSGVGRGLVEHAIEQAPALGIDTLFALIWHDNQPSLSLFESMGFEPWGRMPRLVWAYGRSHDMLTLGRSLASAARAPAPAGEPARV